jgi:hypothetical protein
LFEIGICDELIDARLKAASKCFQIKQRHCEVGASWTVLSTSFWGRDSVRRVAARVGGEVSAG